MYAGLAGVFLALAFSRVVPESTVTIESIVEALSASSSAWHRPWRSTPNDAHFSSCIQRR